MCRNLLSSLGLSDFKSEERAHHFGLMLGWTEPSSEEETFTCSETFFFLHLSVYMIIDYLANKGVNRIIMVPHHGGGDMLAQV